MTKSVAQLDPNPGAPPSRGDETRRRILDAAGMLVAERGWGAVSTRLVADRAGVNQALVHYHFGSKEALLRLAVARAIDAEIAAAVEPMLVAPSFEEGLDATLAAIGRFDPASPSGVLLAEAMLRATRDPLVGESIATELATFRALLADRLRAARDAGEVRADLDPAATATALAALLDGLLLHRIADPAIDLGSLRAALGRMLTPPGPAERSRGRSR